MKKILLFGALVSAMVVVGCSGEAPVDASAGKSATSNVELDQKPAPKNFGNTGVQPAPASGAGDSIGG
jgi:hypothetical protein